MVVVVVPVVVITDATRPIADAARRVVSRLSMR
jgi:hypothetical protein